MLETKEILMQYIRENEEKFYRIAYNYTGQRDAALDVVQEAITKSLENISKLKHEEYVKTWFYRILINESLMYIKKNKKYVSLEYEEIDDTNYTDFESLSTESIDIYNYVRELDEKTKTVVVLKYFENLKLEEISEILHVNVNTVKSRLYKGLRDIKRKMEGGKKY